MSGVMTPRPSDGRRAALRQADAGLGEKGVPVVSNFFPIERYYDAARKVRTHVTTRLTGGKPSVGKGANCRQYRHARIRHVYASHALHSTMRIAGIGLVRNGLRRTTPRRCLCLRKKIRYLFS